MATNLLRGKSGEAMAAEARGIAIGETDAHVFSCPSCARPLSQGTSTCPGCGVRLILGVRLKRAGAILALGLVLGVFVGGAVAVSAVMLSLGGQAASVSADSAAEQPSVAPVVANAAPPAAIHVGVPSAALSALSGTAVVNGRIAVDTNTLAMALAKRDATTIQIARALRSLAADAALGADLAGRLDPWKDAAATTLKLDDFYRAMAQTARVAFRASLTDEAAYRKAGAEMITVLAALGAIDAASRSLATTVDLELPPVALPGAGGFAAPATSVTP